MTRPPLVAVAALILSSLAGASAPCAHATDLTGVPDNVTGGRWQAIAGPFDTPPVNGAPVVRDSRRHRMLLVDGDEFGAQWSLSLPASGTPAWSRQAIPGPRPPARRGFVAVYDSLRDRVLVYGGSDGYTPRSDVWALTLGETPHWNEIVCADTLPPGRSGHAGILDPVRDRLVIFGGTSSESGPRLGDTWAMSLSGSPKWSRIGVANVAPMARIGASAVYDPWLGVMVVFGGWSDNPGNITFDDTWSLRLNDAKWESVATVPGPQARVSHVAVTDLDRRRMIVQGGAAFSGTPYGMSDAWAVPLQGPVGWTPLMPTGLAPVAFDHGAIYSPERHSLITYGGLAVGAARNSCFELNLDRNEWSQISPLDDPRLPARQSASLMILDPLAPRLLVLGGRDAGWTCHDEPWTYSLAGASGWTQWPSSGTPPRCGVSNLVYDAKRDRVLSFGGGAVEFQGGLVNAVSATSPHGPGTWRSLPVTGPYPMGRDGMSLILDAKRDRILMFGGATYVRPTDDSPYCWNDLWALSLGDSPHWTKLATMGAPQERDGAVAMIDTLRDRLVVCGGEYTISMHTGYYATPLHDVWTLSLSGDSAAWQRLGPDLPGPGFPLIDTARDRLLLVNTIPPAAWALPLAQPAAWTGLALVGDTLEPREDAAFALDPASDRLFVFGGIVRGLPRADLHALQFLPQVRQVAVEVQPEPGHDEREPRRSRTLRVTVEGSATFAVDSLARADAFLDGARIEFDGTGGWHHDEREGGHGLFRDLVGHVPTNRMTPLAADSVIAFRGTTKRGMRVAGYAKLSAEPGPRREDAPSVGDPATAGQAVPGLRVEAGVVSGTPVAVAYALPGADPAHLDVLDVQGRRLLRYDVPVPAAGRSRFVMPETRSLAQGLYLVRLTQGASVFTARAVVIH